MGFFDDRRARLPASTTQGGYDEYSADIASWPALTEFLGRVTYSDGSDRLTGSILLFCDQGRLKVMLKEPNEGVVGFSTIDGLDGLLDALERKIAGGSVEWRKDNRTGRKGYRS